ncbi:MAG TPA: hypothetical protein VJC16_05580 [Candidatus Nanoarchaeia archaeon]|nr:hypothetical protein [Candidatus Nanoarchaeia archaeon]
MLEAGSFIGGAVLSFLGIAVGAAIAHFTPAEVAAGRRYFLWAQRAALAAFGALVLAMLGLHLVLLLFLAALMLIGLVLGNIGRYSAILAPILGLCLWLLSPTPLLFLYGSSVLFLYWMVTGTRECSQGWKLAWHSSFLLGAILPFLLV